MRPLSTATPKQSSAPADPRSTSYRSRTRAGLPEVRIGDWARSSNLKGDPHVRDAAPVELWAGDPDGFDQVGCIYSAQGFEGPTTRT